MKRTILYLVFFMGGFFTIFAQSVLVKKANDKYLQGNYQHAISLYEEVLSKEGVAPEVYYNLGNAYYKSNEIGRSILNYERALRLYPLYDDARFNLELTQQKVVDNIIQAPTFFLGRWVENLIKLLSTNQWYYLSFSVFIITIGFTFLFLFGGTRNTRKNSFYLALTFLIITFVSFVFSGVRKDQINNHQEAIVMQAVVTVKSSPDKSGTDLFQLHEGTKVSIKSTLGEWTEIKLGNGNIGWLENQKIEKI